MGRKSKLGLAVNSWLVEGGLGLRVFVGLEGSLGLWGWLIMIPRCDIKQLMAKLVLYVINQLLLYLGFSKN